MSLLFYFVSDELAGEPWALEWCSMNKSFSAAEFVGEERRAGEFAQGPLFSSLGSPFKRANFDRDGTQPRKPDVLFLFQL